MKNPPAIQFYPKDYLADANVRMLSYAQRGIYMDLLCFCWERDGLPSNHELIRKLLGISVKEAKSLLPEVMSLFVKTELGFHHERLLKQKDLYQEKREKAKASAEKRWHDSGNANACETHMPTHCEGNAIIGVANADAVEEANANALPVKSKDKQNWNRLVGEEFQKLWAEFPKKVDLETAERHFRKAVGVKHDLPRLICICLCVDRFTEEMKAIVARDGGNEMVRRLSTFLIQRDYQARYDEFYPEAKAQADEILSETASLPLDDLLANV